MSTEPHSAPEHHRLLLQQFAATLQMQTSVNLALDSKLSTLLQSSTAVSLLIAVLSTFGTTGVTTAPAAVVFGVILLTYVGQLMVVLHGWLPRSYGVPDVTSLEEFDELLNGTEADTMVIFLGKHRDALSGSDAMNTRKAKSIRRGVWLLAVQIVLVLVLVGISIC